MTKQEKIVLDYFNKFFTLSFPFPCYTEDYCLRELNKLKAIVADNLSFKNICIKLIYNYHPSIWLCNKKTRLSPYAAWYDEKSLIRTIENRLQYKGNKLSCNDIIAGFTISGLAPKISIFRPYIAKYIISKYLNEFDLIFDPCSGYSGRLLGAWSLGKTYIGQDINEITIEESKHLIEGMNLSNIYLYCKNSIATKGSYPCLFTCPPYGDKENWNQDIEELTADDWIDICLKNYNCFKYVFIVDKTIKYKKYIVEKLTSKSHFTANTEYVIVITSDKSLVL